MERIVPVPTLSTIYRHGEIQTLPCVSEMGSYGSFLGNGKNEIINEYSGYLLRTKAAHQEDGGVASGVASFNSFVCED